MKLKIWIVCCFLNMMYIVARDDIYDKRKGLTVKDLLQIMGLVLTGPIGTLAFGMILWDNLKESWPKIMNYHIVKPVIPSSRLKKVSLDKVVSGLDKTQPSSP